MTLQDSKGWLAFLQQWVAPERFGFEKLDSINYYTSKLIELNKKVGTVGHILSSLFFILYSLFFILYSLFFLLYSSFLLLIDFNFFVLKILISSSSCFQFIYLFIHSFILFFHFIIHLFRFSFHFSNFCCFFFTVTPLFFRRRKCKNSVSKCLEQQMLMFNEN